MKFSEAMEMLEEGYKVRCADWPKYEYLVRNGHDIVSQNGKPVLCLLQTFNLEWEQYSRVRYDFPGAYSMLKKGHTLRREIWDWDEESYGITMMEGGNIMSNGGDCHCFNIDDFTAKDWVEL
jgi:hypothetical protein